MLNEIKDRMDYLVNEMNRCAKEKAEWSKLGLDYLHKDNNIIEAMRALRMAAWHDERENEMLEEFNQLKSLREKSEREERKKKLNSIYGDLAIGVKLFEL